MIDWDAALESVNSDRTLLFEVVEILKNELPELHNELRNATEAGESDAIRNAAHKFKGSVRFLGPNTVHDLTESIELLEPMDLAVLNASLQKLANEVDLLTNELNQFVTK